MGDFLSGPGMVVAIIALTTGGWVLNNWIRAKHGYDLEDEWGGKTARADRTAEIESLRADNARLVQRLDDHADRLKVLERIVTDKGYDVATQIEALRDSRDIDDRGTGTAINFDKRESA